VLKARGEGLTVAMMPDWCGILGDPGPVRVSPSVRRIRRIRHRVVGCS
jgi:hypothetical protein